MSLNEDIKFKIYVGMVFMFSILMYFSIQNTNNEIDKKYKDYILILDSTSINAKILYKSNFRGSGNWTMKDGKKYSFGMARNYKYRPTELFEFCQRGDSVYKPKGSMNLNLIRNDSVYNFIIGEGLNREFR